MIHSTAFRVAYVIIAAFWFVFIASYLRTKFPGEKRSNTIVALFRAVLWPMDLFKELAFVLIAVGKALGEIQRSSHP